MNRSDRFLVACAVAIAIAVSLFVMMGCGPMSGCGTAPMQVFLTGTCDDTPVYPMSPAEAAAYESVPHGPTFEYKGAYPQSAESAPITCINVGGGIVHCQ